MKIIIDIRERELITVLQALVQENEKFKTLVLETCALEIGDIILRDADNKDVLIYERKTIQDLVASIKDGRYEEQSYRLGGCEVNRHNIIYLIEGNVPAKSKDRNMIFSSIFSLNYYKGFSVMRTSNVAETAFLLCNTACKLIREQGRVPYAGAVNTTEDCDGSARAEVSYSSVIKKSKKANVTVDNFGEIVLCQIPDVSSVTAQAIMKVFGNIHELSKCLREDEHCLDDITYTSTKNQTRKISKLCVKNIIKFLS